ncbi:MAG: hypothetical protein QNJ18_14520 [Xenococcaceae cyanobacterium MO_167.B52]|nr:hypothetical protein [Xenococcaceae cyanobacterium MO_167.B52]
MKNIKSLGYFERQELIDNIARKLAREQGYVITCNDLATSENYQIRFYFSLAKVALCEVENFLEQ